MDCDAEKDMRAESMSNAAKSSALATCCSMDMLRGADSAEWNDGVQEVFSKPS